MQTGYIVMEYIDGTDLGSFILDYEPPLADERPSIDNVFMQVIDGFSYIERHGIIHRDVREQNILVDKTGVVKIIDFGIGKITNNKDKGESHDSLRSKVNRHGLDTLPQEYSDEKYTSRTDMFYVAELFQRLIKGNKNISSGDFSYHNILTKMAK
jgi:serine/threonine-protein kinase